MLILRYLCTYTLGVIVLFSCSSKSHQATGVKIGEVTSNSAIVWMRLTKNEIRNDNGIVLKDFSHKLAKSLPKGVDVDTAEGACPGAEGKVRLKYGTHMNLEKCSKTEWVKVNSKNDFTHQFHVKDLLPETKYYFSAETSFYSKPHKPVLGSFTTAPLRTKKTPVRFSVVTGMGYERIKKREGFPIFYHLKKINPDFHVYTGDTVYYDADMPLAINKKIARYHWHRMMSLDYHFDFNLHIPAYYMKDDHDTLSNNCWPSQNPNFMEPLTFQDGQKIFIEQVPIGEKTFRTFRWGKDLQIWLVEGRDYRSPNKMPDNPGKTIWGAEQKRWLKRTLLGSDATWKILISPTPIIGPDRPHTADNHSNKEFFYEGSGFRDWAKQNLGVNNFFIICGDRHWQYHSIDSKTGIHEFSCGPASDRHVSPPPKKNLHMYKKYLRKGGYLLVGVNNVNKKSTISFSHYGVDGNINYSYTSSR